jgi:hypothetical protein
MAQGRIRIVDDSLQSAISDDGPVAQPNVQASAFDALRLHPWITKDLFAETRRVWSKAYGRIIPDEEVIEILMNVRRLAEVLSTSQPLRNVA